MKDFEKAFRSTARLAKQFVRRETAQPSTPYLAPKELAEKIDLAISADGLSDEQFFRLLATVLKYTPKTGGPKFVNQLFGGRNLPAVCAEMLTGVLNNSMYTYKVAGPHVLIEKEVVRKMLRKVGFPRGAGVLVPGGSISNLGAMILARDCVNDTRDAGVRDTLVAYTSEASHYSILRNAGIIGIGRDNLRRIKVDAQGNIPFFVNATAGTTVQGAFDPLAEISRVAEREKLWLHVDAALGGTALLSSKHRHLLGGCERADSLSWNAHKLMGVPLSCSALLVRREQALFETFSEHADYLFQTETDENDAFKLWAAWKYYGDRGYEERVDKIFALARYATDVVRAHPDLVLACDTESVAVCFCVRGGDSIEICNRLDAEGILKVGYGTIGETTAIRLVCVNPELTEAQIDEFFEDVLRIAARPRRRRKLSRPLSSSSAPRARANRRSAPTR
jgi:glutamate/tyrosine decarboxylase-like PLP-dependent enzyme